MNTYRLVLGSLLIICYLQQHGWAAPSQTDNVQPSILQSQVNHAYDEDQVNPPSIQQTQPNYQEMSLDDLIKEANLKLPEIQSHVQKRQALPPAIEYFRQAVRNALYPQFFCNARELRTDMRINYFEVSNTMHNYVSS